jgi:hypothetical protein
MVGGGRTADGVGGHKCPFFPTFSRHWNWFYSLCFRMYPLGFGGNGGCDEAGSGVVSWAISGRTMRFAGEREEMKRERLKSRSWRKIR